MIAKLKGKIEYIKENYVVVMVGGVGYKIFMTAVGVGKIAQTSEVDIFIHTHVREDNISLYGFQEFEELEMFELLLSVSGIGPKAALGILAIATPGTIKNAIVENDHSILTKVSGVGKKTAERVILELRNKVGSISAKAERGAKDHQEVLEALIGMGYSASEAREALKQVPKEVEDLSGKIKFALKAMRK